MGSFMNRNGYIQTENPTPTKPVYHSLNKTVVQNTHTPYRSVAADPDYWLKQQQKEYYFNANHDRTMRMRNSGVVNDGGMGYYYGDYGHQPGSGGGGGAVYYGDFGASSHPAVAALVLLFWIGVAACFVVGLDKSIPVVITVFFLAIPVAMVIVLVGLIRVLWHNHKVNQRRRRLRRSNRLYKKAAKLR